MPPAAAAFTSVAADTAADKALRLSLSHRTAPSVRRQGGGPARPG